MEELYNVWARRNPKFETQFEESLFHNFTNYGHGSSDAMASKGKIYGGGYELYIYAFFVGLYANKKRPLILENTKTLGQPIQYWGNLETRKNRKAYPKLREFIFAALIAKTEDFNLLELEKNEITASQAVDKLIKTMEEYANFGFYFIDQRDNENPSYFYKNSGFLDFILDLTTENNILETEIIEEL